MLRLVLYFFKLITALIDAFVHFNILSLLYITTPINSSKIFCNWCTIFVLFCFFISDIISLLCFNIVAVSCLENVHIVRTL